MFHEGANFWTSLCFQSALEAKLESWGTEKTFSTRKRVGFIAFLKTNLNQKIYGGYKRFGGLLLLNTLQDHEPAWNKDNNKGGPSTQCPPKLRTCFEWKHSLCVMCCAKKCCTELKKLKAVRLYNHLIYLQFYIITCELENRSKSSKVSIDSDFSLVSTKKLSEILPSSGLSLGPDEVGQKDQNCSTYDVTHKNSKTQNQNNFFHCGFEDLSSLMREFEQLSSAIGGEAMVLPRYVETRDQRWALV